MEPERENWRPEAEVTTERESWRPEAEVTRERENWRPEAEVAGSTGGHVPAELRTSDPLVGGITPRGPDETRASGSDVGRMEGLRSAYRQERSNVATSRRRVGIRRVRRTIRHVDPLSVLKLSLVFYAVFLVVWLVVVAIGYVLVAGAGLFDLIESVREGFALGGGVDISLATVEGWAFIFGLGFAILGSLSNVMLAVIYNVAADLIGGLEITFVERD